MGRNNQKILFVRCNLYPVPKHNFLSKKNILNHVNIYINKCIQYNNNKYTYNCIYQLG